MNEREQIFNEVVRENHGSIYRICLAYLYDRSHVEDLYQEILIQVWNSLDNYKNLSKMSTWVYRIAVNTAITYNSKNKKERFEELPESVNIADDTAGMAQQKETQLSQLSRAIVQLEKQDRLIISLVLEDLSYKDIAEITGSNTNNIGVRISRIKARLMKLMEDKETHYGKF